MEPAPILVPVPSSQTETPKRKTSNGPAPQSPPMDPGLIGVGIAIGLAAVGIGALIVLGSPGLIIIGAGAVGGFVAGAVIGGGVSKPPPRFWSINRIARSKYE